MKVCMYCLEKLLPLAVCLLKMRRSNSSSPEELAKVLKLYLPHGVGLDCLKPNPEKSAACYETVVVEMLMLSARPTQGAAVPVLSALLEQEIASHHCQPMRRILAVISKGQRPQSQGDLWRRHASRKLKKRKSNESEKGTPVKGMSQVYSDMIAPAASNPAVLQAQPMGCMKQC